MAESQGLRRCFNAILDQCDLLNDASALLPPGVKDRRLRMETAIIVGLARRLTERLRTGDPLATRVKLGKTDVIGAVLASLWYLK